MDTSSELTRFAERYNRILNQATDLKKVIIEPRYISLVQDLTVLQDSLTKLMFNQQPPTVSHTYKIFGGDNDPDAIRRESEQMMKMFTGAPR